MIMIKVVMMIMKMITIMMIILEDYHLVVERRFACHNDPESNAGGSVSSW
jgi:hypothetical protein